MVTQYLRKIYHIKSKRSASFLGFSRSFLTKRVAEQNIPFRMFYSSSCGSEKVYFGTAGGDKNGEVCVCVCVCVGEEHCLVVNSAVYEVEKENSDCGKREFQLCFAAPHMAEWKMYFRKSITKFPVYI